MDRRAIIFAMAAALGCLAFACGKGEGEPADNRQAVEIVVSVDGQTLSRVTTSGNLFEDDDKFRFFFNAEAPTTDSPSTTGGDAVRKITDYTYDSETWTPTEPIYWNDHEIITARNFCAVMPFGNYSVGADLDSHKFTVQANQSLSDSTGYKKSDLLMARVSTGKRLIPLRFYHMMAKVVVVVKASTKETDAAAFSANAFDDMTVSLNEVCITGKVAFDALTSDHPDYDPAISVSGDTGTTAGDVKMLELTEAVNENDELTMKFAALIPPQTVAQGDLLLTFANVESEKKKTYYMKVTTSEGVTFLQGKSTIITVTLGKSDVEIAVVEDNIRIAGWDVINASSNDNDPIVLPN